MMEHFVNNNLDDINRKYLNEKYEIGVDEEGGETKDIQNEDLVNRDNTEN